MRQMMRRGLAAALLILSGLGASALAQDYPTKPIRLIIPYAPGGSTDLTGRIYGEALNLQAKIDLVHAAYRGGAPLVQDLVGGQLSSGWLDTATLKPLAQTGKVRILALTGKQRVAALPDVPTFGELGYSGFEAVGFFLSLAPAGTPKDITRKLSEAIASVIRSEDMLNRLRDLGQEPVASTPDELAAAMRSDAEVFDRAIKAAGIKIDP